MRRSLLVIAVILVVLVAVVGANTRRYNSRQLDVPAITPVAVDGPAVAAHLAEAVCAHTASSAADAQLSADQLRQLHVMLEARYPKAHVVLQCEQVGGFASLYTWKGAGLLLRPVMLTVRRGVAPITSGTEGDWT